MSIKRTFYQNLRRLTSNLDFLEEQLETEELETLLEGLDGPPVLPVALRCPNCTEVLQVRLEGVVFDECGEWPPGVRARVWLEELPGGLRAPLGLGLGIGEALGMATEPTPTLATMRIIGE